MRKPMIVTATALLVPTLVASTGGCAEDGCETVKGKYRAVYTLSAGPCAKSLEAVLDVGGGSSSADPGCTQAETKTEGTSTCRVEQKETCEDGRSSSGVFECEDDGATCGATFSITSAAGTTCIYDVTMTRL